MACCCCNKCSPFTRILQCFTEQRVTLKDCSYAEFCGLLSLLTHSWMLVGYLKVQELIIDVPTAFLVLKWKSRIEQCCAGTSENRRARQARCRNLTSDGLHNMQSCRNRSLRRVVQSLLEEPLNKAYCMAATYSH
eukprot:1507919-Amphidinium_carterae.1